MSHVLIVDDEPSICWGFRELLSEEGHEVSIASSAEDALEISERMAPDLVVLDVRLPGRDGLEAMGDFRRRVGDAPIIVVTAFGDLPTAVKAMEAGAYDYLPKPFDLEQAAGVLRRALRRVGTDRFNGDGDRAVDAAAGAIIGSSPAMQEVFKQIALVAPYDVPVLITGESGTGKELVAQAIHRHSRRSKAPYLPISLPALSPGVIESELFGHVRGAFTGAENDRQGLLELADGGTVLFDEIGDVPPTVQVKLLRAIEQGEVARVGETTPRRCEFRVLAATNRSLADLMARGEFRQDLYYRLGVFTLHVPPLRERSEDIPQLARHFLRGATSEGSPRTFSPAALRELMSRKWDGNVRELRNVVNRAAILARDDQIELEHLPPPPIAPVAAASTQQELRRQSVRWVSEQWPRIPGDGDPENLLDRFLGVVEPSLLQSVLRACGDNRAAAARVLGIHRATLRQKLRDYDLEPLGPADGR